MCKAVSWFLSRWLIGAWAVSSLSGIFRPLACGVTAALWICVCPGRSRR